MKTTASPPKITVAEFLAKADVDKQIDALRDALLERAREQGRPEGYMPRFSDMITIEDGKEYQYVDYVQEGGGVLGVALVGYTYALEKLGIRFLKLAGTSAGAINTLMLAAVDPANYPTDTQGNPVKYSMQSEAVLHEMLDYDLWNLVDSESSWWRSKINSFVSKKDFGKNLMRSAKRWVISLIGFSLIAIILSVFQLGPVWLRNTSIIVSSIGLLLWAITTVIFLSIKGKAGDFVKAGFGVNKGVAFHNWMKRILANNKVNTSDELDQKMKEKVKDVRLRPERFNLQAVGYNSRVDGSFIKIISCDVTNENKVEFPDFARFYYDDPGAASPADFVRASMSIPIFYQPFTLKAKTCQSRFGMQESLSTEEKHEWDKHKAVLKNIYHDNQEVRFVDGGILSNFPINVFHNPKVIIARMPTLGAKLEDEEHEKPDAAIAELSLGKYLGSIFSTLRFYYDRDFLKKNSVYQLGLAHIDVAGVNWLNFSMTTDEQIDLFRRGVAAATTFFLGGTFYRDGKRYEWGGYDWEEYKRARKERMIN